MSPDSDGGVVWKLGGIATVVPSTLHARTGALAGTPMYTAADGAGSVRQTGALGAAVEWRFLLPLCATRSLGMPFKLSNLLLTSLLSILSSLRQWLAENSNTSGSAM